MDTEATVYVDYGGMTVAGRIVGPVAERDDLYLLDLNVLGSHVTMMYRSAEMVRQHKVSDRMCTECGGYGVTDKLACIRCGGSGRSDLRVLVLTNPEGEIQARVVPQRPSDALH